MQHIIVFDPPLDDSVLLKGSFSRVIDSVLERSYVCLNQIVHDLRPRQSAVVIIPLMQNVGIRSFALKCRVTGNVVHVSALIPYSHSESEYHRQKTMRLALIAHRRWDSLVNDLLFRG